MIVRYHYGDTDPELRYQLFDANGDAIPLGTATSITIELIHKRSGEVVEFVATLDDEDDSIVKRAWAPGDLELRHGEWHMRTVSRFAGDRKMTIPTDDDGDAPDCDTFVIIPRRAC